MINIINRLNYQIIRRIYDKIQDRSYNPCYDFYNIYDIIDSEKNEIVILCICIIILISYAILSIFNIILKVLINNLIYLIIFYHIKFFYESPFTYTTI